MRISVSDGDHCVEAWMFFFRSLGIHGMQGQDWKLEPGNWLRSEPHFVEHWIDVNIYV